LLETERLVLRLPRLEDAAGVLELVADPDVMRWLDGEPGDIKVAAAKMGAGSTAGSETASGRSRSSAMADSWGVSAFSCGMRMSGTSRRTPTQRLGEQVSLIHPENTRSMRVAEKLGAAPTVTIELMGSSAVIWRHPPGQLPAR
jgi:RimJ/RimL family protein N-acetyltransferase